MKENVQFCDENRYSTLLDVSVVIICRNQRETRRLALICRHLLFWLSHYCLSAGRLSPLDAEYGSQLFSVSGILIFASVTKSSVSFQQCFLSGKKEKKDYSVSAKGTFSRTLGTVGDLSHRLRTPHQEATLSHIWASRANCSRLTMCWLEPCEQASGRHQLCHSICPVQHSDFRGGLLKKALALWKMCLPHHS